METFVMLGKYSSEAIKGISAERTAKVISLIKKFGGEVKGMYAVLGEKDLVFILTLPGIEAAMKVSLALGKSTGISFTTLPAVTVEVFDQMVAKM